MSQFTARSGDVTLSGDDVGDGVPVVLLHGLTATRRYVVMGSKALERSGHRVVSYDARGHGRSSPAPLPTAYGAPELAADLAAVLDDRGIERAVLAGASMGAHTIAAFALAHPGRVAGACFITPAYDPEAPRALPERWTRRSDGLRSGGVAGFLAAYGGPPMPERWAATIATVMEQRLSAHEHPDAIADALLAVPRMRPFERWEDLGSLTVPTVVVADRDEADPEHPLATGECWAAALPDTQLVVEEEGASPLAWQGGRLSQVIAALAARAA